MSLQAIVAVTPFPSDVLCVANGTVYGLWLGAFLSWVGWYLAALIEFGIGRRARSDFSIEDGLADYRDACGISQLNIHFSSSVPVLSLGMAATSRRCYPAQ